MRFVLLLLLVLLTVLAGCSSSPATVTEVVCIPQSFSDILNRVQEEVAYSEFALASDNISYTHEHLVALSALTVTKFYVSPSLWGYHSYIEGEAPSDRDISHILDNQSGLCGTSTSFFRTIVREFGIKSRAIDFLGSNTHVACELYYSDGWHYYDPTWGAYFKSGDTVLSLESVKSMSGIEEYLLFNESSLRYRTLYKITGENPATAFITGNYTVKYNNNYIYDVKY